MRRPDIWVGIPFPVSGTWAQARQQLVIGLGGVLIHGRGEDGGGVDVDGRGGGGAGGGGLEVSNVGRGSS